MTLRSLVIAVAVVASPATAWAQRGAAPPAPGAAAPTPIVGSAPATPAPQGDGAISGVVVDGATGKGVAGAVVTLGAGTNITGGGGPRREATDRQGRFVFTNLPAGSYQVGAAKLGYLQTTPGPGVLTIEAGRWIGDAKVVLWKPGSIGGTVLDERGEPVVECVVRIFAEVMAAGRPQWALGPMVKTDDRGAYRVPGLRKGRYAVMVPVVQTAVPADASAYETMGSVSDPDARLVRNAFPPPPPGDGRPQAYAPTFFPAARSIADADVIALRPGEERVGVIVQLTPAPVVKVSGVIQGPPESHPAGMAVRLVPAGNESIGFGSEIATALPDTRGNFTFLNVPSGRYTILAGRSTMVYATQGATAGAAPPGFVPQAGGSNFLGSTPGVTSVWTTFASGNTNYSARLPLTVEDRDLAGVVVTLKSSVAISGRIVREEGTGPPPPGPVRGVGIDASPANGDATLIKTFSNRGTPARQNTGDTFRIEGLVPGEYRLSVSQRASGTILKSIVWNGEDYTHRPFDTNAGHDFTDVVVTVTTNRTRLSGAIHDSQGRVVQRAAVMFFPTDATRWRDYGLETNEIIGVRPRAGEYTTNQLPAGEYYAIAVDFADLDSWQDPKYLEAAAPLAMRVSIGWGETKTLDLTLKAVVIK